MVGGFVVSRPQMVLFGLHPGLLLLVGRVGREIMTGGSCLGLVVVFEARLAGSGSAIGEHLY